MSNNQHYNNIYKTNGADIIYQLRVEDYEYILFENYSEEEIEYINKRFTKEEVLNILRDKISIDWDRAIEDVIDFRLLKKD